MKPFAFFVICSCLAVPVSAAAQADSVRVVSTAPEGELSAREQANEIRIVFSEPMVTLGGDPSQARVPFVRISPAVRGTFRWSGTTILIFTPAAPLPFSTSYEVTVDGSAAATSGRTVGKPVTFSFTMPTVKLEQVRHYRRGGTVHGRLVLLLTFNQPVRPADIAAALSARFEPHPWEPPVLSSDQITRIRQVDPAGVDRFAAKVKAARSAASSRGPVKLQITDDWNRTVFPGSPRMVAIEVVTPVEPEAWLRLSLARSVRSPAGNATPRQAQVQTVQTERAFFVEGFVCTEACDSESHNPIRFRNPVEVDAFTAAVSVVDAGNNHRVPRKDPPKDREDRVRDYQYDREFRFTLEDAGYEAQPPNRKYVVTARPDLKSTDGQSLGYPWVGVVDNWHERAFTSFGDRHGVWEKDGGGVLPFYARNLQDITQWAVPLRAADLVPTITKGHRPTAADGVARRLNLTPDQIQSHGLDISKMLNGGTGLLWAAVREGTPIPRAKRSGDQKVNRLRSSIVQVTNLGITVKDSPQNTLIFVTRLDNGAPVSGARVSIVRADNSTHWRGATGSDGIALAPNTPLRDAEDWGGRFAFVVIAEKDGDLAYVGSDWTEGIDHWSFGTGFNLRESAALLRGTVFTDRGVYRLGEQVQFKAVLRYNAPAGIQMLPAGTPVHITVRDGQNRLVDQRTVRMNNWSSAEWTLPLPPNGTLGNYSLRATLEGDRPKPRPAATGPAQPDYEQDFRLHEKSVHAGFLVAAYRRPDFRVDVTLAGSKREVIAGDLVNGVVNARYLFGTPMSGRPVSWKFEMRPGYDVPSAITEKFGEDRWVFVGFDDEADYGFRSVAEAQASLTQEGKLALELKTEPSSGRPFVYRLEGDVEDVSRQHIANRSTVVVHPAPWYVGVRRPPYFLDQKAGLSTELIAASLDGRPAAGIPVEVKLTQVQWKSVRRAQGDGFYTWETEREEIPAGSWTISTGADPVPLHVPFKTGGYFELTATGTVGEHRATTAVSFYVMGEGYTAWERFDHNRIQLVPEKEKWKPGDTARLMIQSPWERATALVTTEREGIRTHRQFALTSTMQTVSIPISEADIPNVFVSVVLVKGRTVPPAGDGSKVPDEKSAEDPGKPTFRVGYTELKVEDRSKRLTVAVAANREEYRPAAAASVRVDVKDHQGRGTASEVTLWAVDYGVLSLTGYRTPDVLGSVYVRKALQVITTDNRQRIISRRVLTPKGETEGGGGGGDAGAGTLRKDFRVLAFWVGSVTTGDDGRASVNVKLPESLTTYRIMAVAADRASRFGSGDAEVRTNKPLTLKPTFPRFLAVGDQAFFGAVVGNQLRSASNVTVTMKSLDPGVLDLIGPAQQQVRIDPGGNLEVRFQASGKGIGRARVQMTVNGGGESDSFEDVIPVEVLLTPQTVAAHGEASAAAAKESLALPIGAVPGFGGLHIELASTALVGLGEGARYLVEYPYGCAEQKSSKVLGFMLAADLGETFTLPGIAPAQMRPAAQQTIRELERFQCESGGFGYWQGSCHMVSPYLTAYLLQILKVATDLKYDVDQAVRARAYSYLEQQLATPPPVNAAMQPSYIAWQAFTVKVLVEGGRPQDSHLTRLYGYRERMPIFATAFLHDALVAKGESGPRVVELRRRMMNAILPEAGTAHVEEFNDPYLYWYWSSDTRSTAIVLNSFVKAGVADAPVRQMVRWLMSVRKDGRWGNTQENAYAMEALVNYYRRYEPEAPDFRAVVQLGGQELMREQFQGRSTQAVTRQLSIPEVAAAVPAGTTNPLTFTREGTGTLFYTARLRYAVNQVFKDVVDSGIRVERRYEPYLEDGGTVASTEYEAGDLVRVTLTLRLPKERRYVAVTDPLPAGFEAVESWFQTTQGELAQAQDTQYGRRSRDDSWMQWWGIGGFDHVERHDDRVQLFATRLSEGTHVFTYIARATTSGTFRTAPTHAEEMYSPEIFGRTPSSVIEVKR